MALRIPKFIILDEPVSALDMSIRAQILNLLKGLQERSQLAYVMISHDLAAARYLSTRLAVMCAGKAAETGGCDEVYTTPLHPYTQALLSAAPPLHPSLRRQRLILPGEVLNPLSPPSRCRFHPRCPPAMPQCQTHEPLWRGDRADATETTASTSCGFFIARDGSLHPALSFR
jgi:oligopeptide/dipeptide ABC transporter ATP-binding protein